LGGQEQLLWFATALGAKLEIENGEFEFMTDKKMDDAVAAAAFRRLISHLQHRTDAQNVDLMGLAGFCRNCLGDWVAEAGGISKEAGRDLVYGMPYAQWKADHQAEATPGQLARMAESVAKNR
jgi:uncharacterized protein